LALLRSDVFAMHGYTELYLADRWVKATPAFNLALCRVFNVAPLAFDGLNDSVFHPFNQQGQPYMEYLRDHGQFADVPHTLMFEHLAACYPHLFTEQSLTLTGDLAAEAAG
jgi:transglutaminase-like putative cysteine protease